MTLQQLLASKEASMKAAREAHEAAAQLQRSILADAGETLTEEQQSRFDAATAEKKRATTQIDQLDAEIADLRQQIEDDERLTRAAEQSHPGAERESREQRAVVGRETRTYGHRDMGAREKRAMTHQFLRDVAAANHFQDFAAAERLRRHMDEERVEREAWFAERAVGTGAFSGLVVPQYMVELVAPAAVAGRPFADAINQHQLPEEGMQFNISRITTSTSAGLQATEGAAASETDMDDTLLQVSVQTNAGQQTMSRQAVERGTGTDDIMLADLVKQYHKTLDATLITQATTGLSAAAGATVTYTDASPTAGELYPKILDAASRVEAAGLGLFQGDLAVMHSRRWYWLQSQLSSTWPLFGQPNLAVQQGGVNFGERYGNGFRGILPNGLAVVVDNNLATNLGAGTNEDEIYVVSSEECHLWEDPDAPLLIRTEEVKAATLQILFVLYGYFAYTFGRYSGATAKIAGTGLVTPTF